MEVAAFPTSEAHETTADILDTQERTSASASIFNIQLRGVGTFNTAEFAKTSFY